MSPDVLISSLLFGAALALLAWSSEPYYRQALDRVETKLREKLKPLRIYPKHLRPTIAA